MSQPFADIAPWPPTRHTEPLSEIFPNVYDVFRTVIVAAWVAAFGYAPEEWQEQLVRAVTEIYPRGHRREGQLRWREAVISLGRQNGKTEIAAMIGLLMLLWKARAQIIGLATSAEQARLIYDRTMGAIRGSGRLRSRFPALTETRGIRSATGGKYEIRAAKSGALQGIPIDAALVDELHILLSALWTDMVNGLGGRPDCIVVGITTAGDDGSELLLRLYERGDEAIERGVDARFGFWVWEAPEARMPADDDTLGRYLAMANPSVASGRLDLENVIEEVRGMPDTDAIRYRLNRFVTGVSRLFSLATWLNGRTAEPFPADVRPVFSFDRTPDQSYASVHAFAKMPDGSTYCDVVASLVKPTLGQMIEIAQRLSRHSPVTYGMDRRVLQDLGDALSERGLPVTFATYGDIINGSALFFAKMKQGKLKHPGHPLMAMQIPLAERKDLPEGFRVKRTISSDAVMGHIIGVQLAETKRERDLQLF